MDTIQQVVIPKKSKIVVRSAVLHWLGFEKQIFAPTYPPLPILEILLPVSISISTIDEGVNYNYKYPPTLKFELYHEELIEVKENTAYIKVHYNSRELPWEKVK